MKLAHQLLIAFTALSLTGCDMVKFPGAPERADNEERPLPPPPDSNTTPQAPDPTPTSAPTETTATTPATTEPVTDTTATTLPADTEETTEIIPENGDTSAPATSPYAGIDNLLTLNAMRCAPTSEEASLTLAELANASLAASAVTPQAVNGIEITAADFPGIVKMEPKRTLASGGISSGHCGATRIAKNWFITASHCLDETYDEIDLIATQSSLKDPRAIRVQANASLCHAAYGGAQGQYANDVALVGISDADADRLSSVPIARFGATNNPLGAINYPTARMAGWGLTSFDNGELSNTLLSTQLAMVSSGPALVTVASKDDAGPCIGDSGGPLLIDETDGASKVIGVLSVVEQNRLTGEFCKGDYNARYTNLAGYTGWIEDVIGVCTATPELCAR